MNRIQQNENIKAEKPFKRQRGLLTVLPLDCPVYGATDVLRIRRFNELTQAEFAQILGVSCDILRKWENNRAALPTAMQRLLYLIDEDNSILTKFAIIKRNDEAMVESK